MPRPMRGFSAPAVCQADGVDGSRAWRALAIQVLRRSAEPSRPDSASPRASLLNRRGEQAASSSSVIGHIGWWALADRRTDIDRDIDRLQQRADAPATRDGASTVSASVPVARRGVPATDNTQSTKLLPPLQAYLGLLLT